MALSLTQLSNIFHTKFGTRRFGNLNISFSKIVQIRNIAVVVRAICKSGQKPKSGYILAGRIWAGLVKMAGFRPEPKSGTALVHTIVLYRLIKQYSTQGTQMINLRSLEPYTAHAHTNFNSHDHSRKPICRANKSSTMNRRVMKLTLISRQRLSPSSSLDLSQ
jgi:hypothetical protein